MDSIFLRINSMTHHAIAARREEFVAQAAGLNVTLAAQPSPHDVRCVGAFVNALRIGNVRSDDVMMAQRMLMASGCGTVTGRIAKASDYELLADFGARPLASEEEVERALPLGLGTWTTSVAPFALSVALPLEVETMQKLFWHYFHEGRVEAVVDVVDRLFDIMRYDLSGDMQAQRLMMFNALTEADDERLQRAAERLSEASQRMGGDHQMDEVGRWLHDELTKTFEADLLLSDTPIEVTRAQVVKEAQALPGKLYRLWQTNVGAFARVIYGMRLPRADMRRVMACLVWLELTPEEEEPEEVAKAATEEEQMAEHFMTYGMKPQNIFSGTIQNVTIAERADRCPTTARKGYTDEQVARAIEAICGEGKPLDTKVKWAAVYWYLRWQCNYPVKGLEFCERIASLPFTKKLDPECGYENIRKLVTLSFMNQDARQLDRVKPSRSDEAVYKQCRAVVISLSEELAKQNVNLE